MIGNQELRAKVCHHDEVIVFWDGDVKNGRIKCKNCEYVFWDKRAPISFADAMAGILEDYDE
jgi:hypothetical protein